MRKFTTEKDCVVIRDHADDGAIIAEWIVPSAEIEQKRDWLGAMGFEFPRDAAPKKKTARQKKAHAKAKRKK